MAGPVEPSRSPEPAPPAAPPFRIETSLGRNTLGPALTVSAVSTNWNGLPPPEMVGGYGTVVENGAERIFRQFELEAEHRRKMDEQRASQQGSQLFYIREERRRAQYLAGSYAFGALGVAVIALVLGYPTAAGFIGTTSIATVVAAFLAPATRALISDAKKRPPQPPPPTASPPTTKPER